MALCPNTTVRCPFIMAMTAPVPCVVTALISGAVPGIPTPEIPILGLAAMLAATLGVALLAIALLDAALLVVDADVTAATLAPASWILRRIVAK